MDGVELKKAYPSQVFCHNVNYFSANIKRLRNFISSLNWHINIYEQKTGKKIPEDIKSVVKVFQREYMDYYLDAYFMLASECSKRGD
jgi:hypothetical protein